MINENSNILDNAEQTNGCQDSLDELRELDKLNADVLNSEELRETDVLDSESDASEKNRTVSSAETVEVVGVRFKSNGKIYYFSPNEMRISEGDHVVVDTSRGIEYGTVCMSNRVLKASEVVLPVREVLRLATAEDTERRRKNEELEINAYNTFIERIDAHGMEMKLIDVECAFDNSKLLFYFSAENRIDFRELVRELASIFHTRIELRQIGIRDEAKMLGGLGICGRPFCCSSFLTDFVQVSIKMAKEQNLSLNSAKISGACGRLMCCLRYEYDTYLAEKALTPKAGAEVMTPDGEGIVAEANPMTGIVKVKLSGTAEDDAPSVFVREDLVLKEKYHGEKLTKTPLPEKRNGNAAPASFEVRSPFALDNESVAQQEHSESSHAQNNKENRRDKKKRETVTEHQSAPPAPISSEAPEETEAAHVSDKEEKQGKPNVHADKKGFKGNQVNHKNGNRHGMHKGDGKPSAGAARSEAAHTEHQKPHSSPAPQNKRGDAAANHPHSKGDGKKPYRPYHRYGKNGKRGGDKPSGGSQG